MWCPFCDHWFDGRDHLGGHVASVHREAWDADLFVPMYRCFCYRWFLRSEFMQEHWDAEGGLEVHIMHVTLGDD